MYDKTISDDQINKVLDICELKEFKDLLDKVITELSTSISLGQAIRLSLARTLLLDRDILILDELTSSLDEVTEQKVLDNLVKLNKTIIFISHKESTQKISNYIYYIENCNIRVVKGGK